MPFAELRQRAVIDTTVIAPGAGWAGVVGSGHRVVFGLHAGSQVLDLNLFAHANPREHFGSSVTRMRHGSHVVTGDTLLSTAPWEQPLAHVVSLSPERTPPPAGAYGPEGIGTPARVASHDLLYGRCSAAMRARVYGEETAGCQEILSAALARAGFSTLVPHDPLNVFMRTGIDAAGRLFFTDPATRIGDMFEIELATDCIVAVSACPGSSSGANPSGATVLVIADAAEAG